MLNFKENYHFLRLGGGGTNFLQGGGSKCLFPIETHITCDFLLSPPPLDPRMNYLMNSLFIRAIIIT